MTADLILDWDDRPDADTRLTPEVYASFDAPAVDEDPDTYEEDADASDEDRPDTLGVSTARRDGRLLGWVWVYRDPENSDIARAQAAYVPREAARYHGEADPAYAPEEFDVIARLYERAADEVRAIGLRALRFSGGDTRPEGHAATLLHATAEPGDSRIWSVRPATWEHPDDLPVLAELVSSTSEAPPYTTISTSTPTASIAAILVDDHAYINVGEGIQHDKAEPAELAALFAALITRLRDALPDITELEVFEFEDDAVRAALPLAGLHLDAQHTNYEVDLTPH
ncbi:hypothetical protein [Nocardia sp. CDC160]|uniref:hypothetical protein n=1 Tax=Nocardia sp. CDC160 TaxID=3112166 RepID=UPI002DB5A27A|nr:hypothetical protein [Nocardia sp. CDC160]MEC3919381.1 hypothetical protein [Nocardia sp. CDC160]